MQGEITPLISRTPEQSALMGKYAKNNNLPENIYEDFGVYAHYMVPQIKVGKNYYDWEWFHWFICAQYNDAVFGTGTLLTIEIGPQIGKSILTSLFISYVFGLNPNTSILYATYNETKAIDFTKRYVIKFMGSEKYKNIFPHVALKNELDKKDHSASATIQRKTAAFKDTEFTLSDMVSKENYLGSYRCFGISQGIHGVPADIFIIDDYVDKAESVRSENYRMKLQEWFYNDLPSRLQDNSSIVIAICTRWYNDDIIGMLHLTYEENIIPELTEVGILPPTLNKVRIRAQYRTSDDNPIEDPRTKEGEYLWKAHILKYAMAKKGSYYNCVYNCDTTDVEDRMQLQEEDFGFYYNHEMPAIGGRVILCMDGASTAGKRSNYTAIGAWKIFGRKRYLLKLWKIKLPVPKLMIFVEEICQEWSGYSDFLIEFANSGVPVYQYLQEKGLRATPLSFTGKAIRENVKEIKKRKDITSKSNSKKERYMRTLSEFQEHQKTVMLPYETNQEQAELLKDFVHQITTFTGEEGREDDFVDMFTYLVNYTAKNIISLSTNKPISNQKLKPTPMQYRLPNNNSYFSKR